MSHILHHWDWLPTCHMRVSHRSPWATCLMGAYPAPTILHCVPLWLGLAFSSLPPQCCTVLPFPLGWGQAVKAGGGMGRPETPAGISARVIAGAAAQQKPSSCNVNPCRPHVAVCCQSAGPALWYEDHQTHKYSFSKQKTLLYPWTIVWQLFMWIIDPHPLDWTSRFDIVNFANWDFVEI